MTEALHKATVDRTLSAYFLMHNLTDVAAREAREKLDDYVALLISAGERDLDRLTMCGLAYLRQTGDIRAPSSAFTGL